MTTATNTPRLKGVHVLWILLGFFAVMFAVNGVFLYQAITTFPGEDVKKSYLTGLHYNDKLSQRAEQAKLSWKAEVGVEDDAIITRIFDRHSTPVHGLHLRGQIRAPASDAFDQELDFVEVGNGEYRAIVSFIPQGQKVILFEAQTTDGTPVFEARRLVDCCD